MPRRITLASLIDKAEGLSLTAIERTSDERSALESLPDELFSRIVSFFHDPQTFFSLAATKYSFKEFLYQTRVLLAFALCNQKHRWKHGKFFYRLAAAQGSVEGMLMHGHALLSAGDDDIAESLFREVLALEGDDHDENHFILFKAPANAFAGARFKLALILRLRCAEGELCPEAAGLLQSVVELGPVEGTRPYSAFYMDAVIMLAEMTAEGQTGTGPSPQGALELFDAVAEPDLDGACYFMMGRLHMQIMDEGGEATPAAYAHFMRALELDVTPAPFTLCILYQDGRSIPEAHRPERLFLSYVCLVVAAFKYDDYHAVRNLEEIEKEQQEREANHDGQMGDPGWFGHQFMLYISIKRWVFREAMGHWIGRRGTGNLGGFTGPLGGSMTLHEVLTTPLDELSLPEERILVQGDQFVFA